MRKLLFVVVALSGILLACETPETVKPEPTPDVYIFGTEGREVGTDIVELPNGDFLIPGGTTGVEDGDYDMLITRIGPDGREVETWVYGSPGINESLERLIATSSGYAGIAAQVSTNGARRTVIVTFDAELRETNRGFFDVASFPYSLYEITGLESLDNGGFLMSIVNYESIFLFRIAPDLTLESLEQYPLWSYSEGPANLLTRVSDGFWLVVEADDPDDFNNSIIQVNHLDLDGNSDWSAEAAIPNSFNLTISDVTPLSDGRIAVLMRPENNFAAIALLDSTANLLEVLPVQVANYTFFLSELPNGKFAIAGNQYPPGISSSSLNDNRTIVHGLGADGTLEWTQTFGGPRKEICEGFYYSSAGSFVLTGTSFSFGLGETDKFVVLYNR